MTPCTCSYRRWWNRICFSYQLKDGMTQRHIQKIELLEIQCGAPPALHLSAKCSWLRHWSVRSGEITLCCANSQDHCGKAEYGILLHESPYKHEDKKHTHFMNTLVWVTSFCYFLISLLSTYCIHCNMLVAKSFYELCTTKTTYEHFHSWLVVILYWKYLSLFSV